MIIAVPKETAAGESRVALVPTSVATLVKEGHELRLQSGAGAGSGFPDHHYRERGGSVIEDRTQLIGGADLIARVRVDIDDLPSMRAGQVLVGFADPLSSPEAMRTIAERGVSLLAMELIPR